MSQDGDNTDVIENNGDGDVDDRQQQIAPPTHDDVDESHLPPYKRSRRNDTELDRLNPDVSKVIHIRNLSPRATEADLLEALQHFGLIAYATCMNNKRMALLEFEDLEGARKCVQYAASNDIYVAGQPALFNYSTSKFIQRLGLETERPNNVLIITISNVQYPINVDVVHQVCKPYGEVRRIVMLRRHGTQALIEFDHADTALACKRAVNGADIYSGCCTIKAEFAKVEQVKVTRHDQDQWDYTVQPESLIPQEVKDAYVRKTLLGGVDPAVASVGGGGGYMVAPYGGGGDPGMPPYQHGYGAMQPMGGGGGGGGSGMPTTARDRAAGMNPAWGGPMDGGGGGGGPPQPVEGTVLMIYGVSQETINCDRVFNLLCCYGNVLRVKFMKTKRDTCMVEMNRVDEVKQTIECLHGARLFGNELAVRPSKQDSLYAKGEPFEMPDGTPSFKDFTGSRHQRFDTPDSARRNRLVRPTKILHWYNAPPDVNEDKLNELFASVNAFKPQTITIFTGKSERSSSGIAEFDSAEQAADALTLANHTPMDTAASRNPYIVKMAFAVQGGHPQNDYE